jgi:hypothetical protein
MNRAVQIVTIKAKHTLYKGINSAERIELIELEENGFDLVSQKGLYEVGDKAVYIQPDYNLSNISLFEEFLRPGGEISKSMLGKVEGVPLRIRAKKFTFSRIAEGDHVYSNGILLPYYEVSEYLYIASKIRTKDVFLEDIKDQLDDKLGITKWEEPEHVDKAGNKTGVGRKFPEGIYKTDETNINNLWGHIKYPIVLVGTKKEDGSSITILKKNGVESICSRNLEKPIKVLKHIGRREKSLFEKILFWTKSDLNLYKEVDSDSNFVTMGLPILQLLKDKDNIAIRGELNGGSNKGSGNKNNPSSREASNIKIFGIDNIEKGIAKRLGYYETLNLYKELKLNTVEEIFFKTFNSKEEIKKECEDYFKLNLIEGIVLRDLNGDFSAKYMNNYYDSKK